MVDAAGDLDEEAVAELGGEGGGGEKMDALLAGGGGGEEVGAAFAVVAGGEGTGQERGKRVVGGVGELVAVADEIFAGRPLREGRGAGGGVAVGAEDGDGEAGDGSEEVEGLAAFASESVAELIVPGERGVGLDGEGGVEVLGGLFAERLDAAERK